MGHWDAWLGRTLEQSDALTSGLLQRFRATIDSDATGAIAPQGIHWCLCLPETGTAELGEDGHPKRGDFMPPIPLPRRMWAASKVDFIAPIQINSGIKRISKIAAISEKSGAAGDLIFVDIEHETHAAGSLAIKERQTVVYREASTELAAPAPEAINIDWTEWHFHREIVPTETLLFRYSALTFNSHRIHYDQPYATGAEGYRGPVVHGPLIATLMLDLVAREFGPNVLKRFTMRARSPAFSGEPLHLVGKADGSLVILATMGSDGRTVMSAEAERS